MGPHERSAGWKRERERVPWARERNGVRNGGNRVIYNRRLRLYTLPGVTLMQKVMDCALSLKIKLCVCAGEQYSKSRVFLIREKFPESETFKVCSLKILNGHESGGEKVTAQLCPTAIHRQCMPFMSAGLFFCTTDGF